MCISKDGDEIEMRGWRSQKDATNTRSRRREVVDEESVTDGCRLNELEAKSQQPEMKRQDEATQRMLGSNF